MTIEIGTERLMLTPFTEKELTSLYISWLNNPKVVKYSELRHTQHTMESCKKYYESFKNTPHQFWAIKIKKNESHIGNITVHTDVNNKVADIGILIGETTIWGQGYGLESWKAMCTELKKKDAIRKITAGTLSINFGMIKIMQHSGMIEDGKRNKQCIVDNELVDVVHYCILK